MIIFDFNIIITRYLIAIFARFEFTISLFFMWTIFLACPGLLVRTSVGVDEFCPLRPEQLLGLACAVGLVSVHGTFTTKYILFMTTSN